MPLAKPLAHAVVVRELLRQVLELPGAGKERVVNGDQGHHGQCPRPNPDTRRVQVERPAARYTSTALMHGGGHGAKLQGVGFRTGCAFVKLWWAPGARRNASLARASGEKRRPAGVSPRRSTGRRGCSFRRKGEKRDVAARRGPKY